MALGDELVALAEALVAEDQPAIDEARERLAREAGPGVAVDAAGVASNFQRMVRIADATGIELGDWLEEQSREVRDELGLERFAAG